MGCFVVRSFFVCPRFFDKGMFPFFGRGKMVKHTTILHLLRDGCV